MDSNALKEFVIKNNIRQRTIDSFWKCFENYRKEEVEEFKDVFGEFDINLLTIEMHKIDHSVRNWDEFEDEYHEYNEYIEAYLYLRYKGKYIGWYSLLFNFDGAIFDDFFTLE